MTTKNDHTGDALTTGAVTNDYREGWERIFAGGEKKEGRNYLADCFATPDTASPERIRLALKAVEGLSTELLRDTMLPMYLVTGAAAIQTYKRLGIEIDNVGRLGEKK